MFILTILFYLFLVIISFILIVILFLKFGKVFGGKAPKEFADKYVQSPHFRQGRFHNIVAPIIDRSLPDFQGNNPFSKQEKHMPKSSIPHQKINPSLLLEKPSQTRITWLGHSSFIIETSAKVILVDPMFSSTPSPVQWIGRKRYAPPFISLQDLPEIDVVLITHDHYDHLDYSSIKKLRNKVKQFVVPLGISGHLTT